MDNELKLIENELVPVYETSTGEKVVNGRELWKVLKVKSRFNGWIKERLSDVETLENIDFITFTENSAKGRPTIEYIIKLDIAKEMAMLERNEIGKQVRRYFIKIEKKYKLQNQSQSLIEYDNKIQHVEQRIEKLEDTMTIDYGQQNDLRMLGNSVVVNALGGYETNAYKAIGKKVFARLWKDYKIYFRVNSYKNTPRKRYFEAQDYIVNWHPDANTSIMIKKLNAQKEVGALA